MTSRLDSLDNELLNLKDVIIKSLQVENQSLRKKVNVLENKVLTLESKHNSLEQYGRWNNIEITAIPDYVPDQNLEEKVVDIFSHTMILERIIGKMIKMILYNPFIDSFCK